MNFQKIDDIFKKIYDILNLSKCYKISKNCTKPEEKVEFVYKLSTIIKILQNLKPMEI